MAFPKGHTPWNKGNYDETLLALHRNHILILGIGWLARHNKYGKVSPLVKPYHILETESSRERNQSLLKRKELQNE